LGTGFSDNSALTMTLTAGGGISETTEDGLLHPAYLPGTITIWAASGLAAWLTANTMAQGTILGARYTHLLFTTKDRLFKGNSETIVQVSTAPWSLAGGRSRPTEEGIKDVTKTTEIKSLKTPPEKSLSTTMSKAVIGSALVRVGEHLIGFVYLLKPVRSPIPMVMVGMILKG